MQEPRHRKAVELLSEVLDLLKAEGIAMAAMELNLETWILDGLAGDDMKLYVICNCDSASRNHR